MSEFIAATSLKPGDLFCYRSYLDTPVLVVKTVRDIDASWDADSGLEHVGGVLLVDRMGHAGRQYKAGEEFTLSETVIHLGAIEWEEGPERTASAIGPGDIFVHKSRLFVCSVSGKDYTTPIGHRPRVFYDFQTGLSAGSFRIPGVNVIDEAKIPRKYQTLRVHHCLTYEATFRATSES